MQWLRTSLRLAKAYGLKKLRGVIPTQARELLDNPSVASYTGRPKKTEIYAEQRGIKGRCLRGD